MKSNPMNPSDGNYEGSQIPDFSTIRDNRKMSNPFSQFTAYTPPSSDFVPYSDEETVVVPKETITALKTLLDTIAETFREHGMVDLAVEADEVAALL
tara:strand:- start:1058 stop:1348 length:291 start_codon:yes stop_codon:yes gene_type:complete